MKKVIEGIARLKQTKVANLFWMKYATFPTSVNNSVLKPDSF